MKVKFKLKDGRTVKVDTERVFEIDDKLFAALMDTIEYETGDWTDMDEVTKVTITI